MKLKAAQTMQKLSTKSQIEKYGGVDKYKKEMSRRVKTRFSTDKDNTRASKRASI